MFAHVPNVQVNAHVPRIQPYLKPPLLYLNEGARPWSRSQLMRLSKQLFAGTPRLPKSRRTSSEVRTSNMDLLLAAAAAADAAEPTEPAESSTRATSAAVQKAAAPQPAATAAASRAPGPRGAALRWTSDEDAVLRIAVSENRKTPDKRSQNGIQWAAIQRRAPLEYPLLMRHLTGAKGSKTLAKRWCQYLNPDDQLNKARRWR